MASTISAGTTSVTALNLSGDTTGNLAFTTQAGTNTITVPNSTGNMVVDAATQTLTNKSIVATQLTGTIAAARLPAGSVLQVVQGTVVTTTTSTSSTTFVTTGITASITPSSVSSKILVFANTSLDCSASGRNALFTIYRNSTNVVDSGSSSGSGFAGAYGDTSRIQIAVGVTFLDSPATTSATTYTIYVRTTSGGIIANPTCNGYVTVMEIAG